MKSMLILLLCWPVSTLAGWSEGVGGGDPMAAEVVELATKFRKFIGRTPHLINRFEENSLRVVERKWRASLRNSETKSLVIVVEERPMDGHGVPKAAVYDRSTSEVRVHRATWVSMDRRAKLELVAMELLGLAHVHDRYERVMNIVKENIDLILQDPSECPRR